MSYELVNRSTQIHRRFSKPFWAKALELAELYGWHPMGTHPRSLLDLHELGVDWNGTYLTNDGQVVNAEDARSLAAALERALDDVPNVHAQMDWSSTFWLRDDLPEWLSPDERAVIEETLQDGLLDTLATHPFDFFAGEEKRLLIEFIRFCRLGSFEIW